MNVKRGQSRPKRACGVDPDRQRLGHVHVHGYRRGTFLLYWNDERIVVLLKRVGSFLSISYKVTHFYASQPTSTIVRPLGVNPTTHDWLLRWSWTCPRPSKIYPSCESPINRGQNVPVGSTPTDTIGPRSCSRLSPRYVLVVLKWRKNRSTFKARRAFSFDFEQSDSFLNLEPGPSALKTVAWWPKRIAIRIVVSKQPS